MAEARRISHYRILKKLGEGGMGEIYAAVDERLGRKVALKLLPAAAGASAEMRLRMLREAQAASALNHPGIVTLHDVGAHAGQIFLVMELIDGESFGALALRRLDPAQALALVAAAADALAFAHAGGVLHRDIKSDNLMRTRDGRVKVLDFGLAKVLGVGASLPPGALAIEAEISSPSLPDRDDTTVKLTSPSAPPPTPVERDTAQLTRAGTILGTPSYMAPEQTQGDTLTERSEVFSLGVVLYELLTGARPFSKGNVMDTIEAVRRCQPTPPSEKAPRRRITPAMDALVLRALARRPEDRFAGMAELAAAIREVAAPPRRRWPLVAGGAGLVAVVAAAAVVVVFRAGDAPVGPTLAGPARRLTFDPGCEEYPSFTPDGRTLVFDALVEGDYEVVAMDLALGTRRRLTRTPGWDYAAVVAPDGARIVYTHQSDTNNVRVLPLAGGEPTLLGESDGYPTWNRAGEVLFSHGDRLERWSASAGLSTVARLPEDRRALYLIPFRDGGLAAILGTLDQEVPPQMVDIAGGAITPLAISDAAEYQAAASPSGRHLYHLRASATGFELVRRPRQGGAAEVVPGGVAPTGGFAFSPDGKTLVYSTCKSTSFVARIAAGAATPLTRPGGWTDNYPVPLDDEHLLVTSDRAGTSQVWRVALATGAAESFTGSGTLRATVAADRRQVAWATLSPPGIVVAPLVGKVAGTPRRLTDRRGDTAPQFTHDGRALIFVRIDAKDGERVYLVPVDGSAAPRPLTPPRTPYAATSPASAEVVYLARGAADVKVMSLEGDALREVMSLPAGIYRTPRIAPGGRRILVIREDQEILEIDRAASPPTIASLWRGGPESATAADYMQDGSVIATVSVWEGDLWLVEGKF